MIKIPYKKQIDLIPLWKALADAKRRRIIQLLSEKTRTTSEISAYFDVSRFAIMRHLKVLEQVGLIKTRREGRQRWNFLNEALFQQIQLTYLENHTDGTYNLTDILNFLARQEGERARETAVTKPPPIELEIDLRATPDQVFRALVQDINAWWNYRLKEDSHVHLEPHLGGRFYEAFPNGGGVLYAHVNYLKPGEEIRLAGSMGLAEETINNVIHLKLRPSPPNMTRLQLTHRFLDNVNGFTADIFKRSWLELLDQQFKSFLEQDFPALPT